MMPDTLPLGEAEAAARNAIMDRRTAVTGRVSETTRYIGFGLLAVAYAMISGSDEFFVGMRTDWPGLIKAMALCGALAIVFDYLHYVLGYVTTDYALDRKDERNSYDEKSISYRLEHVCFWAKQVAALAGCVVLIFLVAQGMG